MRTERQTPGGATAAAGQHGEAAVLEKLKHAVLDLAPGGRDAPPERRLAEMLDVPRHRLRRALAELRAAGQLPPAQVGRRARRTGTAQSDLLARVANPMDVIELRIILEPQFARLAALRASPLEIARLLRAASSRPGDDYAQADIAFHQEVARSSRNALAGELYQLLRHVGTHSRVRLPPKQTPGSERRVSRDREHMAIATAIAERDPDRAEAAMRAHLASVQRVVMQRLTRDPAEPPELPAAGVS